MTRSTIRAGAGRLAPATALRPVLTGVLATGTVLALAACGGGFSEGQADDGGTAAGGGAAGETLIIGNINPVASFNPINQTDVAGQWANEFVLDSLLDQPKPLEFTPELATSIDTEDNQTYTVNLDPSATWSDGEPVTADDVAFTLNLIANPESITALGTSISSLDGVDPVTGKLPEGETEIPGVTVVDEQTVELKTAQPVDPNYISEIIGTRLFILPAHHLKDIAPADFGESDFAQLPDVTSGPYTYLNYTKDVSIEFAARDDYYEGTPKIPSVAVRIMPAANLVGDLQTGAIHMNSGGGIGNIPVQDLATVKGLDNVTTNVYETLGVQFIEFNTETVPDVEVRSAMAHAINREQIVDQLLQGEGQIVDGPYTSQSPYLDTDQKTLAYDPDLSRELLEDTDFDEETTLRFVVPTGNAIREQSADIILENLKAVGFKVEQTNVDFPTLLTMAGEGDYDMLLIGNTFNIDPDVTFMYGSQGSSNYTGYSSERADALLAKGKSEPDTDARAEIYDELQAIWQEDLPQLGLYSDNVASVVSNEVTVGGAKPFWRGSLADLPQWSFGEM
ncbi:peptide/nickel transport system substrate-binding protein [Promicromonospora sp. AC04]|uniref:ABC transporter substrate-binding protein n=1 Tax=Promicromonospora sp. AC04 TaxID=2135723 RepID=UPI000D4A4C31|nr:ABC transporter substrate-binding protein [Promicromonospora sp. AC04]PUB26936.1 peptide/nickel transport system substrate-binding protein [Promicromonospora sp. AC04]